MILNNVSHIYDIKKQAKAVTLSNDEDGTAYYLKEMLQK